MKKIYVIFLIVLISCKKETVKLNFINEFTVKDSLMLDNTIIGGISGIDYHNNDYYMVIDDAWNPRVLMGDILIKSDSIKSVAFKKVIRLNDTLTQFYNDNALDLESIFVKGDKISLVSEGSIRRGKNPTVFEIDINGTFQKEIETPNYFKANSIAKPKHNAAFESSSKSIDDKGFWVAMEAPLGADGEEPTFHETESPVRITYFDDKTNKASKQFAYQLEKIDKPAKGKVNLNGVTAILQYTERDFFVIERIYQSGYGSYGNVVRIFKASIEEKSTNTLNIQSLKEEEYVPLKKELLFDFSAIQEKLTDKIIDNIEGITFGPKLSNGNQSLILVSDDNFQAYGKQLNQFILLEIIDK
ncbi:esterase-like activity of phytase family protein [Tenacibaculum sp. S7007]|uniref:Esterase-like activity of phytase family protein n=1 Tax=Tenacibaculum pelagium TaxID=2759527 RepID=A0A839AQ08_9FLAO|nr:esterase-like activity of phytase family protein [Tenacibaculum pelagium]MBA6156596.1 esterase-like activity of phytase family protein [Tenacibaculum pelagium]